MKKVSKGLYLGMIIIFSALGVVFTFVALPMVYDDPEGALGLIFLALLLTVVGGIFFLILLHKAWKNIQDGYARTTPGKAVGYLFIPLYSFYWFFQAFRGFAQDYNSYLNRHSIQAPQLSVGLYTSFGVLVLCGIILSRIPGISVVYSIVDFIIVILIANNLCDAINNLPNQTIDTTSNTGANPIKM